MKEDPNRRLARFKSYGMTASPSLFGLSVMTVSQWPTLIAAPTLSSVGAIIVGTVVAGLAGHTLLPPLSYLIENVTPRLPPHLDRQAFGRMVEGLSAATRNGLTQGQRASLQRDMQLAREVLEFLCEKPVWIVTANKGRKVPLDVHLALRGDQLTDDGYNLADCVEKVKGSNAEYFANLVGKVVPLVVSIARDFGLDTNGYEAPHRPLPGQIVGPPLPIPEIAAPTISLANEWLSGSRGSVPETMALAADSAARKDLDDLQRAWQAARTSAQDDAAVIRVDDTYRKALAGLSQTISDAIAARSAGDETDLRIHGRYIETKHGDGDISGSLAVKLK